MQKSGYIYRGYITCSGRPSLPFVPNQTDRTSAESSHGPSFTVDKDSSLNPVKDDGKWHHETSTVYGGPVEEFIGKIMDDVNRHSTISPSIAAGTVTYQPHDSARPTEVCAGDYCYDTNKGGQQPNANYVRNEKIDDSDTAMDQSKTTSTGNSVRPTCPTWAANPGRVVKRGDQIMEVGKAAPSTLLGNPTARGHHYNQGDQKKSVLGLRQDNCDDANKPSMPHRSGSIWPNHEKSSSQGRASQPIEPTNTNSKFMEPNKEATKPASRSTSPSTGLYGATSRGDYLNKKELGKPVAHNVDHLRNSSGRKPAMDILGGYPKPSHVMEATLPSNKAHIVESTNYQGSSLEPPKEYGKPASVTAAFPMEHNNVSGHTGVQSNKPHGNTIRIDSNALEPSSFASASSARPYDMRKDTLPLGDSTHGIRQPTNNNGKLKEAAKPTPIAIAAVHPTGINSTAGRNEHKPVGNNSWDDNSEYQNRRHGSLAPTSITNNGVWAKSNPPGAVSLSATGAQIGDPVNGSKAVELLNEVAKPTHRPAAPPEPKYNILSSAAQKKDSFGKTVDSGEAPRRYVNLDHSSQPFLQTAEKNAGSIDSKEAARKYKGILLRNNNF